MHQVSIVSTGAAVPERVLANSDLEKMIDTSDEWIRTRTGIRERRIADEKTASSDLAAIACRRALEDTEIKPEQIELLIVSTVSPDKMIPSTACILQDKLGAAGAVPFDINAGCTGFIYALSIASQFLQSGVYRNALVVGVDLLSRITDWQDRSSCILFGDAAGAAVLLPDQENGGLGNFFLAGDGSKADLMHIPSGGSRRPASHETVDAREHYMRMNGNEIFRFAVKVLEESAHRIVADRGVKLSDIDWIIPHHANRRIIEAACKRLKQPPEKIIMNIERLGNTSTASIPAALDEAVREGKVNRGDLLALVAFGAGLTWGGCLLEW